MPADRPRRAEAVANTIARTGAQDRGMGRRRAPRPRKAKGRVDPYGRQNALSVTWGQEIEKVSDALGWDYTTIDGKGTAQG